MILSLQGLVEYVGISGGQLAHVLGRQAERAGEFVGDHKVLVTVVALGLLFLLFGRRRRT